VAALALMSMLALAACGHDPGPGQVAPKEPVQGDASGEAVIEKNGYRLRPLATFALEARVLHAEHYRFDREADLAPVDLALGWGPMSDSKVLHDISVGQGMRVFTWWTREFPIPREEIESHAANMHLIPATSSIERRLKDVGAGDVVTLEGLLVEATASDGWTWTSSTTRADTGMGACEVFYVRSVSRR
jgi:hypothetical protein